MGRRRKSKGRVRMESSDPHQTTLSTANENTTTRRAHPSKLKRRASAKMSPSTTAAVGHRAVAHDAVTAAPSDTVTTPVSCSPSYSSPSASPKRKAPQTPKVVAAESTRPPCSNITTAAPATSPLFKDTSTRNATTPETNPASSLGADKPELQEDSVPPAPPSTARDRPLPQTYDPDSDAAAVAKPGGRVPRKRVSVPSIGTSVACGATEFPHTATTALLSGISSGILDQLQNLGVPKPTGPTGRQGPASGLLQYLHSALGWVAWAAAHAYTGWLAWRLWVQHEPVSLAGDRCPDAGLVVIMLLALHSYTAFLVLRKTGLWESLMEILIAAGNLTGNLINTCTYVRPVLWTACFAALLGRATLNTSAIVEVSICAAGQLVLFAGCWVYSQHPKSIRWTTPLSALLVHHLMALLFVHLGVGYQLFDCADHLFARFMSFSQRGAAAVLGYLTTGKMVGLDAPLSFAYIVLPAVLFVGALANLLFHYGLVTPVIAITGWLAHHVLRITSCEAIVALANVFFGMGETLLLVLPYVARMTRSELHLLMTAGFATISAALLPVLASFNLNMVDVTISPLLSTFAAIASSKLLYPETEYSVTAHDNLEGYVSPDETCVEALASGFVLLVSIVPAIGYSLVAYLSAAAFVHDVFNELGRLVRLPNFTPHAILTILLKPMVLLMGVGLEEAHYGARVLATGFLSNELGAFQELTTFAPDVSCHSRCADSTTWAPWASYSACSASWPPAGRPISPVSASVPWSPPAWPTTSPPAQWAP